MRATRAGSFGFQWHVTDRCNLRCRHCYQERFDGASEGTLVERKLVADRIFAGLGQREVSINLTGGEPLLVPWLTDLIEHLQSFPTLREVTVITNGTRAEAPLLARLAGLKLLSELRVSLEAADPAINDEIRGVGSFERVAANIERYQDAGLSVVLMMTLSQHNLEAIAETAEWARQRGLAGVIFERFVPMGLGDAMAAKTLARQGWRDAVEAISSVSGFDDVGVDELLPYRAFWLDLSDDEPALRGALCNLGDESMGLMPDGTVYPCRRLPIAVGNVLDEPFEAILKKLASWSVRALRPRLEGRLCSTCAIEECAGCRALARALTGELLADDPQCYIDL